MRHIPEKQRPQIGLMWLSSIILTTYIEPLDNVSGCDCHIFYWDIVLMNHPVNHTYMGTTIWLPILFFHCKTHRFSSYVLWILQDTPYFKALCCHLPREMKVNDNLNQDSQLTWFNKEKIYVLATCALSPGQVLTLYLRATTETLQWKFQYC